MSGIGAPVTLDDYAQAARSVLDPAVWDFLEGGAGGERTLKGNVEAFDRVRLRPRVLAGPGTPDAGVRILGRRWPIPVGIAPMAYHTLACADGEVATGGAAGAAGVPLVVSTFAGRTFADIAAAASAPLWLQVYCFRDRDTTRKLIEDATAAGFEALVLTADAPRLGTRPRDVRHGFRLPAGIAPANLPGDGFASPGGHALAAFDAGLDWSVIDWLRSVAGLPVLVKGILTGADARRAVEAGADGVVVSNHGGRQLDGAPPTLEVLPEVAAAVGGAVPVLVDGGIRRGTDVLAALASGADAALLGRPVLHGLAVAGEKGATHVLEIIAAELAEAMALTGTRSAGEAGPELVRPPADAARAPAPVRPGPAELRRRDLHGSVSDPLLDTMTFLNEITHRYPDAVSFAPGRPTEEFFETEQVFTHLRRYLDHLEESGATPAQVRSALFQYGATGGQIRELIADWLRRNEGVDVPAEAIVVTAGCQEAMLLAVRALIAGPDDVLLVSSPCYVGITGAARLLDVPVRAVAEGERGPRPADVEAAVLAERARGRRPRAFYLVPDHANPSGATVPIEARRELLDIASRLDVLLLEDSPYRMVSPGRQLPTLKSLDRDHRVVHLGSFAKTLFPGARVGFAVADQPVAGAGLLADELNKIKSMVTLNTSPVSQAVVAGMLLAAEEGTARYNATAAAHYGDLMRLALEGLEECFPEGDRAEHGVRWNEPSGGFFLSVDVPFRADDAALVRSAEEFGVVWTPMAYFHPEGGGEHSLRLSVSYLTRDQVRDGIHRLARFIRAQAG
ncbi:aminotransferase class I/II-fold pyridoxal phosphate-dependent enzyme [Actinomadura opuntiae]|uniref:aminotransferase class I/II-fold pyridoxal phosphate-dependent enzyme n=1 Tax=Actinomadura sp. OS1-43 TaxID=604315 RepID=UPI00255ABA33|nr:aminotransferase class I/II-fold pyridoxal phosphate-dependent enzyme [Actinomadura sp. OS1-43]MDL4821050.1 aminotransferase class I/II-fold pyridoxal phosphate-dependent enzyme [Actinomadura sp. OS1-43]